MNLVDGMDPFHIQVRVSETLTLEVEGVVLNYSMVGIDRAGLLKAMEVVTNGGSISLGVISVVSNLARIGAISIDLNTHDYRHQTYLILKEIAGWL